MFRDRGIDALVNDSLVGVSKFKNLPGEADSFDMPLPQP